MSGVWASWISQIDRNQELDTIVYLGAGYGRNLSNLRATNARRIVLVEPNPSLRDALKAEAANDARITIMPEAISARTGDAPFNIFNAASFASLRAPVGLLEVLPGLKLEETITVETVTPQDLFQSLKLAPEGVHALVLDVPGEDATVVDVLATMDVVPFEHVMMCCAGRSLYEGLPASADLPVRLDAKYYKVVDQYLDDTVFLKFWLRYDKTQQTLEHVQNASAVQIADLRTEQTALTQQMSDAQGNAGQQLEALAQERSRQQTELATLTQKLGAAYEQAAQRSDALEQERSKLQAELAMFRRQMRAVRDADMDDLRQRYAALREEKRALEIVLQDVTAGLIANCEPMDSSLDGDRQKP